MQAGLHSSRTHHHQQSQVGLAVLLPRNNRCTTLSHPHVLPHFRSGRPGGAASLAARRALPHQLPPSAAHGARCVQGQGVREDWATGRLPAHRGWLFPCTTHLPSLPCLPCSCFPKVECPSPRPSPCWLPCPVGPQELASLREEQEDAPPLRELREVAPSESRCGLGCCLIRFASFRHNASRSQACWLASLQTGVAPCGSPTAEGTSMACTLGNACP